MEVSHLFWQILAIIAVGGLFLVIILAIIEPGPLQNPRSFRRHRRAAGEDGKQTDSPLPEEDEHRP